jgi:hypothetical protein
MNTADNGKQCVMRAKAGSRGAHVMPLSGHPSRMSLGAVACAKAGSRVGLRTVVIKATAPPPLS